MPKTEQKTHYTVIEISDETKELMTKVGDHLAKLLTHFQITADDFRNLNSPHHKNKKVDLGL